MLFVNLNSSMNGHQIALADALYELLGDEYIFIEFGKKALQYGSYEEAETKEHYYATRPYILQMYKSAETERRAKMLIETADVMRTGGEPYELTQQRILSGKLTFRSSERLFKRPVLLHKPSTLLRLFTNFSKLSNPNYRLLCQSAYLPNDIGILAKYRDKLYKFAYFTAVKETDIDRSLKARQSDKLKIVWCARFLKWKHPELPILLAKELIKSGRSDFEIKMIGAATTPLWHRLRKKVVDEKLDKHVIFTGGMSNADVLTVMEQSNVFLFTSDRNEGWGAVLNEAMGAGCACVASHEIGSVPYLITNDINGLIFKSGSAVSLYKMVSRLYEDRELCASLGRNAYKTISEDWSAKVAAKRLVDLSEKILKGEEINFTDGPCSKAAPVQSSVLLKSV